MYRFVALVAFAVAGAVPVSATPDEEAAVRNYITRVCAVHRNMAQTTMANRLDGMPMSEVLNALSDQNWSSNFIRDFQFFIAEEAYKRPLANPGQQKFKIDEFGLYAFEACSSLLKQRAGS